MLPVVLAYATLYLVWGSTYLAIKEAVHGLPPAFVISFRYTLGGILLLSLAAAMGRFPRRPTRAEWRTTAILAVLLILGGNADTSSPASRPPGW